MKKRTVIVLLHLLLPLAACNPNPPPTPEPVPRPRAAALALEPTATQPFDYYLLNLSWSPEFCATHPTATECAQHPAFVLHGLWPQNTAGPFPQHCSKKFLDTADQEIRRISIIANQTLRFHRQ